ncbi:MAG: glycosyltransferase [Bacteroidales bacterium]|nr:glycosyltransferase [Bacteroidales bacterium]MCM1416504.1 glycosyltransferase [bacterium]MCM1422675.1 glycosyltransferase [bacterium]
MIPISVCIIGRNEEQHIANCLAPLAAYPFEIVYVDTGSEDRTKEIAAEHGAKTYDFSWIDDFSAARNFAMEKASYDRILFLDCDEYLTDLDEESLYSLAQAHRDGVGRLLRNNYFTSNGSPTNYPDRVERLFSRKRFHYIGIIHEQVVTLDGESPIYERYDIPLTVDHAGYSDQETRRRKAERNNNLLFRELKKKPEDPYLYFQIGQSYNAIHDYENAYMHYKKSFALPLDPYEPWVQIMATAYINAMNHTGRSREAVRFFEPIYAHFADDANFYCSMGNAYLNLHPPKPLNAMAEYLKALQCPTAREEGANSFIPYYNIGLVNEMMGQIDNALGFYQRAAEMGFVPAKEKIKEITAT